MVVGYVGVQVQPFIRTIHQLNLAWNVSMLAVLFAALKSEIETTVEDNGVKSLCGVVAGLLLKQLLFIFTLVHLLGPNSLALQVLHICVQRSLEVCKFPVFREVNCRLFSPFNSLGLTVDISS